jgi:hypothetical protein
MSLENNTEDLCNRKLQVEFVLVLFLDDFQVILVYLIILIFNFFIILSHSIVLFDSLIRFVVHVNKLVAKNINNFLCEETCSNFIYYFLNGLNLADQGVSFCLISNSLPNAVQVKFSYLN